MWQRKVGHILETVAKSVRETKDDWSGGCYGQEYRATPKQLYYGDRTVRIIVSVSDAHGRMPMDSVDRVLERLKKLGADPDVDVFINTLANRLAADPDNVEGLLVSAIAGLARTRTDLLAQIQRMADERK